MERIRNRRASDLQHIVRPEIQTILLLAAVTGKMEDRPQKNGETRAALLFNSRY